MYINQGSSCDKHSNYIGSSNVSWILIEVRVYGNNWAELDEVDYQSLKAHDTLCEYKRRTKTKYVANLEYLKLEEFIGSFIFLFPTSSWT